MKLYPHRQGTEVPATQCKAAKSLLTLTWKAHTDNYAVSITPEGRRMFTPQGGR